MNIHPRVKVLILNWNRCVDTLACLESVRQSDYPALDICVIDNGSVDGSTQQIHEHYPDVEQLLLKENFGYAEGNNRGAAYAIQQGADYLFILNNDTTVDTHAITALVEASEKTPGIGAVGPLIYYYSDPQRIWSAGGKLDWRTGIATNLGLDEEDHGQFNQVNSVDYIVGTAMLVKSSIWEKIGPFDQRFFMYWEETDWCVRTRQAGLDLKIIPSAKIWHKISPIQQAASPFVIYYMVRNNLLLLSKAKKGMQFLVPWFFLMKGILVTSIRLQIRGKKAQAKAYIRGAWDFYISRFGKVQLSEIKP